MNHSASCSITSTTGLMVSETAQQYAINLSLYISLFLSLSPTHSHLYKENERKLIKNVNALKFTTTPIWFGYIKDIFIDKIIGCIIRMVKCYMNKKIQDSVKYSMFVCIKELCRQMKIEGYIVISNVELVTLINSGNFIETSWLNLYSYTFSFLHFGFFYNQGENQG